MPATITEHPTPHQSNPARSKGSAADLIRTIGSVQAPAVGPWEIGSGQRFGLAAGRWRSKALNARVLSGTLIITDDLLGSSLDFTVLEPDTGCCVGFSARVARLLSVDSWQADGRTTATTGSRPVSLRLRYNGVFCERGRQPSLWLTVEANVNLPELEVAVGSRRAGRLKAAAELNLNPTSCWRSW